MKKDNSGKSFLPERGAAWGMTMLFSVLLTVTILFTAAVHLVTSGEFHRSLAEDGGLVDEIPERRTGWNRSSVAIRYHGRSGVCVR